MSCPRETARVVAVPPLASWPGRLFDFRGQRQDIGRAVPAPPGRRHSGPLGVPLRYEAEFGHAIATRSHRFAAHRTKGRSDRAVRHSRDSPRKRADGVVLTDKLPVRQPVYASGGPLEPSGYEFGAGSEFVDGRGQVPGQVELASYPAIGILGSELDGIRGEAVLGQHVPVRQEVEQVPFRQRVDRLLVAVDQETLAIVHGLQASLLERGDIRGELDPDALKQVGELAYPSRGVQADFRLY